MMEPDAFSVPPAVSASASDEAAGRSRSPRRLRIAVFNRIFSPAGGGAERYSIALVEQFAEHHEIHVFAQEIRHTWQGVTYHRISTPMRKPRWINQLWYATATWWATRRGFDVVHSHENTWHGQVQTAHVLPVKHNLFNGRTGASRALRWLKVATSPRLLTYLWLESARYRPQPGRQVVVTSPTLQAVMAASYPGSAVMTSVITPGIRMPAEAPAPAERLAARQQLGLPADAPCLLLVGNDYRKKGLPALLEALALLPATVVLAVVGNPAQIGMFRAQAQRLKLAERVFFLGALDNVQPAYLAADCLVHPTLEDTYAMVVLEAMSYQLPVVVSSAAYCGIAASLVHGSEALLLEDPKSAPAIANAVRRVLDDAALRVRLVNQAKAYAQRHEWPALARQQELLYLAACDEQGNR